MECRPTPGLRHTVIISQSYVSWLRYNQTVTRNPQEQSTNFPYAWYDYR